MRKNEKKVQTLKHAPNKAQGARALVSLAETEASEGYQDPERQYLSDKAGHGGN